MSAPTTVIVVTAKDLVRAAEEIREEGCVEWVDQGGNTIRLELPRIDNGND